MAYTSKCMKTVIKSKICIENQWNLHSSSSGQFNEIGYSDELANDWTPETGFRSQELKKNPNSFPQAGIGTIPKNENKMYFKNCNKLSGSGNHLGFSVILNADIADYYCLSTKSYGFKVLVHNPNDLPRVAEYGVAIPVGHESRLIVAPILSEASNNLRKLSKHVRHCIFEHENFLQFYR